MYKLLCKLYQMLESIVDIVFRKKSDFSTWVIPKEIAENEEKGNKYQPSTDSLKKVLDSIPSLLLKHPQSNQEHVHFPAEANPVRTYL